MNATEPPRFTMRYDPWVQLDNGRWVRATRAMLRQARHFGTPEVWHDRPPKRGLWMAEQIALKTVTAGG